MYMTVLHIKLWRISTLIQMSNVFSKFFNNKKGKTVNTKIYVTF